tara:strand:- start:2105 stop:2818 length:714 start_codon:yes stop_codon:yes gene_type:complete
MTDLAYLKDSYLKGCDVIVQKADNTKIILDKTVFYYNSGGQPNDLGTINCNSKTYQVLNVYKDKETGDIIHEVDKPGIQEKDHARCSISWERRYNHMRMHTAMHILSRVISEEIKDFSTGNQIGQEKSRIDFAIEDFSKEKAQEFLDKTNEILKQDHKIDIFFMPRKEMLKDAELFRLKNLLPKDIQTFRIVQIGTADKQADGGTHVRSTKEVGLLKLLKIENKGKENRRLYFKLAN